MEEKLVESSTSKILNHLERYGKYTSDIVAGRENTVTGIAEAIGIPRENASALLDSLLKRELVKRDRRHIKGSKKRLYAYFLTREGEERVKKEKGL
jgi:DNA-binding MarR family transcriptional regulator